MTEMPVQGPIDLVIENIRMSERTHKTDLILRYFIDIHGRGAVLYSTVPYTLPGAYVSQGMGPGRGGIYFSDTGSALAKYKEILREEYGYCGDERFVDRRITQPEPIQVIKQESFGDHPLLGSW